MSYRVVLIPGDGIGPEVCAAARTILDASGVKIEWQEAIAGQSALDAVGDPLPEATLKAVETADATLKGPTATPKGVGLPQRECGATTTAQSVRQLPPCPFAARREDAV